MVGLILFLNILPIIIGAPSQSTPAPCCYHHQFSATLNEIGGQIDAKGNPSFLDFTARMQFDYDARKLYLKRDGINAEGKREVYQLIMDYNTADTYYITPTYCAIVNGSTEIQEPCVTKNATFLGRSTLGAGHRTIEVNNWEMDFPTSTIKIAVTTDGTCTPVMESTMGTTAGVTQQLTIFFTNITSGLDDPSLFTVPSNCIRQ